MIAFDLRCSLGHVFEAWFGSSAAFEDQRARRLVSCPLCQDCEIEKAVMAPNIATRRGSDPALPSNDDKRALIAALAEAQSRIVEKADYVGRDFADRARAMHLGEEPSASIYGEASRSEAISLIEEGVAIAPLPFPVVPPSARN